MSKWRAKALEHFPAIRKEIEAADSISALWIELIAMLHSHYRSGVQDNQIEGAGYVRSVSMYAIWCSRSESQRIRDAALIEFYEYLPKFALECPETVYRRIVADLVSNIGMAEVAKMGAVLAEADRKRFLTDAHKADDDRKRKSQRR